MTEEKWFKFEKLSPKEADRVNGRYDSFGFGVWITEERMREIEAQKARIQPKVDWLLDELGRGHTD